MNKYCTKVKLRAAIVRESRHFTDERLKMFLMQCDKDAGGLFVFVTLFISYLNGSLIINTYLLEILNNISVILRRKKYDTDTSLNFSPRASPWYSERLH